MRREELYMKNSLQKKLLPILLALIMVAALLPVFAGTAVAADITEKFTTEADGSTTFSEGGLTFNITGGYLHVRQNSGWGYDDDFYVDNDGHPMTTATTFGSFKSTTSDFNVHSLYLTALDNDFLISLNNDILIRGKLNGNPIFTHTVNYNEINITPDNNYLTYVDLSSYSSNVIDELEFAVDPYESYYAAYLMIDDFKFTEVISNAAPVASDVQKIGRAHV